MAETREREENLAGLYFDDTGQDTARFLFLPVSNAREAGGTHWSLLFVDRRHSEGPQAHHYDSSQTLAQMLVAARLAGGLGVTQYSEGQVAQQTNNFDCGVSVLTATRALVARLASGQAPEAGTLQLGDVIADRAALQARLGAQPGIADEDMAEGDPDPSYEKMDEGPDLAALARQTVRNEGENVYPGLSTEQLSRLSGVSEGELNKGPAFQAVSAQDKARLDAIARATPRQPGQSNGAWADALKASHPDLSAADAAKIVGASKSDITKRAAFQAVSAQDKARLDAIARATPRQPGQSNGAWA
ncbi:hypothetical protein QN224_33270, partial [Sinorhizobium sp. 8-89]|nr:hypothetical protein [Sinorhizobium sp. 7-81]